MSIVVEKPQTSGKRQQQLIRFGVKQSSESKQTESHLAKRRNSNLWLVWYSQFVVGRNYGARRLR
jgi:hypothetical protein